MSIGIPQEYTLIVILSIIVAIGGVLVFIYDYMRKQRRKRIDEQVQRIETANDPNYQRPDDGMYATIKDGVIRYRRKKKR
jgi:uncharacterized membrane protein